MDNKELVEVELKNTKLTLFSNTVKEVLVLLKEQKKQNTIQFIITFLTKNTSLSNIQVLELSIQEALSVMMYYRFYFWDNLEIGSGLLPNDLLRDSDFKLSSIDIENYKFNNSASLGKMQKAESLALVKGDMGLLSFYFLAAFCEKGIDTGLSVILETKDSQEKRNSIIALNNSIKGFSNIHMDLLQDNEKITLISNNNYSIDIDKGFFLPPITMN